MATEVHVFKQAAESEVTETGLAGAEAASDLKIMVSGRRTDISSRFREHILSKLSRVDRFGLPLRKIDVEVSKENNPRLADRAYEVEMTCYGAGSVIRAEAAAGDKYTALDMAWGRLEQRLRRTADRARYHRHGKASMRMTDMPVALVDELPSPRPDSEIDEMDPDGIHAAEVFSSGPVVVREKVHEAQPMSVEEALTHMEMVDHDFYLFVDVETNMPSVVYRRRGYDYGLIRVGEAGTDA